MAGKGRATVPKREVERETEEGMYRISSLLPRELKKACIIGIFHPQIINPTHPVSRLPDASLESSGFTQRRGLCPCTVAFKIHGPLARA